MIVKLAIVSSGTINVGKIAVGEVQATCRASADCRTYDMGMAYPTVDNKHPTNKASLDCLQPQNLNLFCQRYEPRERDEEIGVIKRNIFVFI